MRRYIVSTSWQPGDDHVQHVTLRYMLQICTHVWHVCIECACVGSCCSLHRQCSDPEASLHRQAHMPVLMLTSDLCQMMSDSARLHDARIPTLHYHRPSEVVTPIISQTRTL
jgi:hypothetical protein